MLLPNQKRLWSNWAKAGRQMFTSVRDEGARSCLRCTDGNGKTQQPHCCAGKTERGTWELGLIPDRKDTVKRTNRGFALHEFTDRNGVKCSVQKSSIATEDCIWLGCNEIGLRRFEPGKGWSDVPLQQDHPFGITHSANTLQGTQPTPNSTRPGLGSTTVKSCVSQRMPSGCGIS